MVNIINYIPKKSIIHQLKGSTKLLFLILFSTAAMLTYDTRYLFVLSIIGLILFKISKVKISEIKVIALFTTFFLLLNIILIFFFAPLHGTILYNSKTIITKIGFIVLTEEELFYLLNVLLKYLAVVPIAILFIVTTYPSEFAASLNSLGLSYKISYSVSIALRYVPTMQEDFNVISKAQQARGIDMSKNVKFSTRFKNLMHTILPLIFSSLARIDVISNALVLRGFSKYSSRTWFHSKKSTYSDYLFILFGIILIIISILLQFENNGRFYNPF